MADFTARRFKLIRVQRASVFFVTWAVGKNTRNMP